MSHPIAVFVSGTGRHLENFVRLAQAGELDARVVLVLCDRAGAGAIERAQKHGLQPLILLPADFEDSLALSRAAFDAAREAGAATVLLAGFLSSQQDRLHESQGTQGKYEGGCVFHREP